MTFERPEFLLALLLAGLPAAMYLSRYVRSRKTIFPAAYFMFGHDRKELARLRTRQLVTTIVRIGLVAGVAFGFAGPVSPMNEKSIRDDSGRRTVLVFDVSASMASAHEGRTSLILARQRATRLAKDESDACYAVVACPGPAGELLWVPAAETVERIKAVEQTWGRCDARRALTRLHRKVQRSTKIILFSDFRSSDFELTELKERFADNENIELVPLAAGSRNLALMELTQKGTAVKPIVQNFSQVELKTEIVLECAGETARETLSVPARSTASATLRPDENFPAGTCSVSLGGDDFDADNELWFELRRKENTQVVIVEGSPSASIALAPSFFISSAMRASGLGLDIVRLTQPELSYDSLALADILVLVDPQPMQPYLERGLLRFVLNRGKLWFFAGNNMTRWSPDNLVLPRAKLRPCVTVGKHPFKLGWVDREDAALRRVAEVRESVWGTWTNLRHIAMSFGGRSTRVLARFSNSVPAMMRVSAGKGEMVLWSLVPQHDNGNLPLHPLFPLLVSSFLDTLIPDPTLVRLPPMCETGRRCKVEAQPSHPRFYEGGAGGGSTLTGTETGEVTCNEPGPYFTTGKQGKRLAFVCSVPAGERQLRDAGLSKLTAARETPPLSGNMPVRQSHGSYFLLAVVLLTFVELWLVTGRQIGAQT